jgi:hypothetical protein
MDGVETPFITAVEPREGFRVWVSFSDGVSGEFDAADFVEWTVPESYDTQPGIPPRWKDRSSFEAVHVDKDGWALHWGHSDGLGNDIWLDDYRAYAAVLGRPADEIKVEWWGEDTEPLKYPQAVGVEAREGYRVFLEYDDGVSGEVDLSHLANTQIFGFWQEPGRFAEVTLDRRANEITWGEDLELCAWHMYEKIAGVNLHGPGELKTDLSAAD